MHFINKLTHGKIVILNILISVIVTVDGFRIIYIYIGIRQNMRRSRFICTDNYLARLLDYSLLAELSIT